MEERAIRDGAFPTGNVNMGTLLHAKLWHVWANIPQFSICLCNGSVMGDGMGMVACSDFVIAVKSAFFVLSDIKTGLTPANLSPFLVAKIGLPVTKKVYCWGENLSSESAKECKLINEVVRPLWKAIKRFEVCASL